MRMNDTQQLSVFIHAPVLHGFGDVRSQNIPTASKIGDGARHFEHAMVGARGEIQTGDSLPQQRLAFCIGRAVAIYFGDGELCVGFVLADQLPLPCRLGSGLYGRTGFAVGLLKQVFLGHGGDFDLDVDAVQQRAGDLAAIARDLSGVQRHLPL